MSGQRTQHDSNPDDTLDELLARAVWPETSPASTRRLERYWGGVSPARRRRFAFRKLIPIAGAAAVVIAAWIAGVPMKREGVAPEQVKVAGDRPAPGHNPVQTVGHVRTPSPYDPRPLTDRDRLLLHLASISSRSAPAEPSPEDLLLRGVLADVTRGRLPGRRLREHARRAQERLLEQLAAPGGSADERLENVKRLASIASARALPALIALARDPQTRQAALPAVLRLADAPTLAMLARDAPAAPEARDLLASMLRREPRQAVRLLLPLIDDPATFPAAIGAVDSIADDPSVRPRITSVLLDELQGSRVDDRLAAARALGRFDDPRTAARLAEMAQHNVARREALSALLWAAPRSGASARALEAARRSARLASTVRSLEIALSAPHPPTGPQPAPGPAFTNHSS